MKLSKFHKKEIEFRLFQIEALKKMAKVSRFVLALPTGCVVPSTKITIEVDDPALIEKIMKMKAECVDQ